MFSVAPIATYAFAGPAWTDAPADAIDSAALGLSDAARCWLLQVSALPLAAAGASAGGIGDAPFAAAPFSAAAAAAVATLQTLRYSTHGYRSHSNDSPALTHYDGRIAEVRIERRMAGASTIGGLTRCVATVTLLNPDGALDELLDAYALTGRDVTVSVGDPDDPLSGYVPLFSGSVESVEADLGRLTLQLADTVSALDTEIQTAVYAGSGGTEGGDDLKDKPKPLCYGYAWGVAPPLVDSANLIYQVHAGAINDVPAVYDRGIALTQVGGAPAAGQYSVDTATGRFTLGATPAGTVTADVEGYAPGGTFLETASAILQRILVDAGMDNLTIDTASFDRLATANAYHVGLYIGPDDGLPTVGAIADRLLAGIHAWGGIDHAGKFSVGALGSLAGEPAAEWGTDEILDLAREPLPAGLDPLVWRVEVPWQRNYTPQTDLAAGVTAARRTWAAQPTRLAVSQDETVRDRHRRAAVYTPPADYAEQADAAAEALRLWSFWSVPARQFYRVRLPIAAALSEVGTLVRLTHPRFGLAAGRPARVLERAVSSAGASVELRVLA